MNKSGYSCIKDEFIKFDADSIIIFLHDFFDSPHSYPNFLFNDFWSWICFTIDKLTFSKKSFYIKEHPNQITGNEAVISKLRKIYPEVRWIKSSFNNLSFVDQNIKYIITAYGTISHEMAYWGIGSLCCASHPHEKFDFCITATSIEEYERYLVYSDLIKFNKSTIKEQALIFFYMHNLHGSYSEVLFRERLSEFWILCHKKEVNNDEILVALNRLSGSIEFKRFINLLF